MTKDVDEQLSLRFEPGSDASQELFVIAHMFEHFYRHDSIKAVVCRKVIHVCGHYLNILDTPPCTFSHNKFSLRKGVGDCKNSTVRVMFGHPERKRSPTTSKFEYFHSVSYLCALAGERQHYLFSRVERRHTRWPVTTAVLQSLPQYLEKKFWRNFVMLFVRFFRMYSNRTSS